MDKGKGDSADDNEGRRIDLNSCLLYRSTVATRPLTAISHSDFGNFDLKSITTTARPLFHLALCTQLSTRVQTRDKISSLRSRQQLKSSLHVPKQAPIHSLSGIGSLDKNIHPRILPAGTAPVLFGFLFLLALLLRLSRINVSTHHLSILVHSFGVNSIDPAL